MEATAALAALRHFLSQLLPPAVKCDGKGTPSSNLEHRVAVAPPTKSAAAPFAQMDSDAPHRLR